MEHGHGGCIYGTADPRIRFSISIDTLFSMT